MVPLEDQLVSIVTCGTQGSKSKKNRRTTGGIQYGVVFSYFGPLSRRSSHRLVEVFI